MSSDSNSNSIAVLAVVETSTSSGDIAWLEEVSYSSTSSVSRSEIAVIVVLPAVIAAVL